ncbi:MAG: helix-turn-helix domain-containing protein [Limisphaerales bacterium]
MNGLRIAAAQPIEAISKVYLALPHHAQFSTIGERQSSLFLVSTIDEMDAKTVIGNFVRRLREQKKLTQDELASRTGITYQYLSGLENGRENFSIGILESLGRALDCSLPQLVAGAFVSPSAISPVKTNPDYFRPHVPLPPGLKISHLQRATDETQRIVSLINANLLASGAKPLPEYIQGNNFSGLVSNILCDAIHENSPYKHNSDQAYPDLINPRVSVKGKPVGLEIKSTIQIGKGGESHNGHSGWHLVACFTIDQETGNIRFAHVMLAVLNGHNQPEPDWVYVGSKVNVDTGSRRTETYNTTLIGTTKLRDGSVYLDPTLINFKRWRQSRRGPVPSFSMFAKT